MLTEIDIYRSASMFIQLHGEDAPLETAQRRQCLLLGAKRTCRLGDLCVFRQPSRGPAGLIR